MDPKENIVSPVSLGRSAGANPFVEYRFLTGRSKNRRALTLYSGMLGTFLQRPDLSINHYAMPVNGYSAIALCSLHITF